MVKRKFNGESGELAHYLAGDCFSAGGEIPKFETAKPQKSKNNDLRRGSGVAEGYSTSFYF
jgi:hypothetical protein